MASVKSLHNPSSKRLAARNLIACDLESKSVRSFMMSLLKERDPWLRVHAHRLLERAAGTDFYMDPGDIRNASAWIKRWRTELKKR